MTNPPEHRSVPRIDILALDGPANFRDVGGYPTADGGTVRLGRVFRSDSLSYLSDSDLARLRDQIGIRTVIDLRAPHEVEDFGHGPLQSHVRQLHMPIVDQTRAPAGAGRPENPEPRFLTLVEIYQFMLREYGTRFGAVLTVIADLETHPVVFHCAAGKDRTGLTAALILGICGVPDDLIVADFAVTEAQMPTMIARHRSRAEDATDRAEIAVQNYGATPETMASVLAGVRADHGSIVGYVESIGVTSESIEQLRGGLIE